MKHTRLSRQVVLRLTAASLLAVAVPSQPLPARAEPPLESPAAATAVVKAPRLSNADICRTLALSALDNGLPEEFFTRLIWQESRFDATAISPAGAQGIAQFMPETAAERGLIDSFRPLQALRESASYLRGLRMAFGGNLGLAAAAYNAGPGRVEAWLAGRGRLPGETLAYVSIVTGHPVEAWTAPVVPQLLSSNTRTGARCLELVRFMIANPRQGLATAASPAWGPWGVQLAGNTSEARARAAYEQLRRQYPAVLGDRQPLILSLGKRAPGKFIVRVSAKSREEADALCARLQAAGGACAVLRNPSG